MLRGLVLYVKAPKYIGAFCADWGRASGRPKAGGGHIESWYRVIVLWLHGRVFVQFVAVGCHSFPIYNRLTY